MTTTTLPIPTLSTSSLEHYIQAVNQFPILTEIEEHELAQRFHQENDLEAARQLVLSHLRVVVSIAKGYRGYQLPQADLIQEGNIGLMKAVKRFDPTRGIRLFSFAVHWIRAEIHEFIVRNWRLVKIATTKAQRKLFFNLRSLKPHFGSLSTPEIQEVAQKLGVKPAEVREMEMRFAGQDIALEPFETGDDENFGPLSYLKDENSEPLRQLEQRERDRLHGPGLESALASLDSRSQRIIEARWLNDHPATLHDLAAEFNVSAERIRQIEQRALQKMKVALI